MTYGIRPASRSQAKPLIGIYSESGKGKTYTSLLLARGFAGSKGKIVMIETESGRGEAYADQSEYPEIGGYDVISMRDSFSPTEYGQAISVAEKASPDVLIIDSASHEWEGIGGVLDMASKNQEAGKRGPIVWQQPKMKHSSEFMLRFMQSPIPLVILNMRAKYPMEEITQNGKKEWSRSKNLEPKQSEDILYEMFIHGWLDDAHNFHLTKCTAKGLLPIFGDKKPLTVETGAHLKEWASGKRSDVSEQNQTTETKRELTPNQKNFIRIRDAIAASPNEIDLFDLWNTGDPSGYSVEIAAIKTASEAKYNELLEMYNNKKASFPPDYSNA